MNTRKQISVSAIIVVILALYVYSSLNPEKYKAGENSTTSTRTIIKAIDGDTLVLDGDEMVRIIGVDTPELRKKVNGRWREIPDPSPKAIASRNYIKSLVGKRCAWNTVLNLATATTAVFAISTFCRMPRHSHASSEK